MGNIVYNRPPEIGWLSAPPVRTPFTDITSQIGHSDGDKKCYPFELRYVDCQEAYGYVMGKEKCKYYYQDYVECVRQWKQMCRVSDMQGQHYHMWLKGVLGKGEKLKSPWYQTPRYDGYTPSFEYQNIDVHWVD